MCTSTRNIDHDNIERTWFMNEQWRALGQGCCTDEDVHWWRQVICSGARAITLQAPRCSYRYHGSVSANQGTYHNSSTDFSSCILPSDEETLSNRPMLGARMERATATLDTQGSAASAQPAQHLTQTLLEALLSIEPRKHGDCGRANAQDARLTAKLKPTHARYLSHLFKLAHVPAHQPLVSSGVDWRNALNNEQCQCGLSVDAAGYTCKRRNRPVFMHYLKLLENRAVMYAASRCHCARGAPLTTDRTCQRN